MGGRASVTAESKLIFVMKEKQQCHISKLLEISNISRERCRISCEEMWMWV
jgi:hypothetical protein